MKSSISHLLLIMAISTMASLSVFAQKRFDNPQQNRKIVVTKSGPKSKITEKWIPLDSDSIEFSFEILNALLEAPKTRGTSKQDSTREDHFQRKHLAINQRASGNLHRPNTGSVECEDR